jgi:hypothetical protein
VPVLKGGGIQGRWLRGGGRRGPGTAAGGAGWPASARSGHAQAAVHGRAEIGEAGDADSGSGATVTGGPVKTL